MAYESQDKMVSHPDHYQAKNGMEVINVIEAFTEGLNGIEATDTGNIIKYACRWKHKNGIQDLEKIIWYTQHLIDYLKAKEEAGTKVEQTLNTFDELGFTGGMTLPLKSNESYSFSFIIPADKNPFVTDLREVPEVDASKEDKDPQTNLVKVVHIDYEDKPTNTGTYYFQSYDDLKVGDIVECDTKNGCALGQVVKTNDEIDIYEASTEIGTRRLKFCRKRNGA